MEKKCLFWLGFCPYSLWWLVLVTVQCATAGVMGTEELFSKGDPEDERKGQRLNMRFKESPNYSVSFHWPTLKGSVTG